MSPARPLRIGLGILQDDFELTGEYQAFRGWAEGLSGEGLEARLFSPGGERLRGAGFARLRSGEVVFRKILEQWGLAARCARVAPGVDVLHLFLPMPFFLWIGDRVKRLTDKPVVVTCLAEAPELGLRQWLALCRQSFRFHAVRLAAAALAPASRFLCDRYLVGNGFVAEQLERAGCPAAKLAVALPRLPPEPEPDERSLALARELAARPTFLYVGHFLPNKGVEVLLQAFAALAAPEARLLLAWSGLGDAEVVRRRLRALRVADRVRIAAHPVHRSVLFAQARALAAPFTSSFGQVSPPVVMLEAFRAGVPLIVSRAPSTEGFGEDGRTLWRVPPGDWRSLRDRMALALAEPALAAGMREEQRRVFARKAGGFDFAAFYGSLVGAARP